MKKLKFIHSTDPRKPLIMSKLKAKSGATKVTQIREVSPGVYAGICMKRENTLDFQPLGMFSVTDEDCGIPSGGENNSAINISDS